MSKELIVSATRHETRVAVLEDDQVVEIFHQREKEYSLAGSIHKGRVTRVLPGMQSAFVDIGLERDAFLYVSDFFEDNEEYDKIAGAAEEKALKGDRPVIVERAPEPRPVEPVSIDPPPPPPLDRPAAAGERPEDGDRDRRGRRSRRRRTRGRGFPESKYASFREEQPQPAVVEAPAVVVAEPESEAASEPASEFSVLPGESLAKYSAPPFAEPEAQEEPAEVAEEAEVTEPEPEPEPEPEAAGPEPVVEALPPEPVAPEPPVEAISEQVAELPEGVIPDQLEAESEAAAAMS